MGDLPTEAQALAIIAARECKSLRTLINGNADTLAALDTTAKTSLVAAINELKTALDAVETPDLSGYATTSAMSAAITAAIDALIGGAPGALDTLNELAAALADDASFASSVTTALAGKAQKTIYLFGLSGQSNSYGAGGSAGSAPTPPSNAYQWTTAGGVAALALTAGTSGGETFGTSCVPQFAVTYQKITGRACAFVSGSMVDGAAMAAAADGGSGNFDTSGTLRAAVVSRYLAAEAAFQAAGYTVVRAGIIWAQGEQDAVKIRDAVITEATYKTALTTFFAYLRTNLGASLPIYMVRTGPRTTDSNFAGTLAVRGVQEQVAFEDPSVCTVARETQDFSSLSMLADTVHYNQTGQNRVGIRVAQAAAGKASATNYRDFYESGVAFASAVSLSNGTYTNITSLILPAGIWLVSGHVSYNASSATATVLRAWTGTTSAADPPADYYIGFLDPGWSVASSRNSTVDAPVRRYVLTTTTTVYLIARPTFSAGTVIGFGKITAIRE